MGGRPGNYKTQLMWNLAVDLAERQQRVLVVALEPTPEGLAMQAVSRFSQIPLEKIEGAHQADSGFLFSDGEGDAFDQAEERLKKLDLYLRFHNAHTHGRGLEDVFRSATRNRFDAVFVDHIGMIGRGSNEDQFGLIARATDGLRALAHGEVCDGYRPFVCVVSPLKRPRPESGKEPLPSLEDFYGSSTIESDADLAMILRKRKRENAEESEAPDVVDAFVVKNRQGRCPLILQFEAQGSICFVNEKKPEAAKPPPEHWQESTP